MEYTVQIKSQSQRAHINYHFKADSDYDAALKVAMNLDVKYNFEDIIIENEKRKLAGENPMSLLEIFNSWKDHEEESPDEILLFLNDDLGYCLFSKQPIKKFKDETVEW